MIDVRVFTRDGVEKDYACAGDREIGSSDGVRKDLADQQRILEDDLFQRVRGILIEGKAAEARSEEDQVGHAGG